MKLKNWLIDFAKGGALGAGILPGVSVGTVGFIVNVYDKLIDNLAGLKSRKTFMKSLAVLFPIGFGCVLMTVVFLLLWKKVAYEYFPFVIVAMLAGFVVGGLPVMTKELKGAPFGWTDVLRMGLGFLFATGIGVASYLAAADVIHLDLNFYEEFANPFAFPYVYLIVVAIGFISAVACLVPGISGSMIMFIFNLFNPIVTIIISGKDAQGNTKPFEASIFENQENMFARILVLLVLLAGILVGFVLTSVAMKKLLTNHRKGTFDCVIGFVGGSVVAMFINNEMYGVYNNPQTSQPIQYIMGGVLGVAVAVLTFYLVKRANKKNEALALAKQESEAQGE